ncbi:acidic mammalian chitinase-like [Pomacea canaliculata]|uniref:acidic mammalian chitinase-like n=1 Tax=Pomacea canaliculata TaxID=400727 RepID=UPI000D737CD3|nr:acidic mammalian chitinase-like [Pomacea canaliculata]
MFGLLLLAHLAEAASSQRIVCYVNGWAQYRPLPATFVPGQVDPFLCTHIVFASAQINGSRLQPAVKEDLRRFKDIQRLKINNPQLKTMLSVGGWDMGSLPFSILVNDSSSIREFAETTTKFLREHGFDGLDVDWRFPTQRGGQRQDGARFTLLLKDIRVEFERESVESGKTRLMLSVVVGSSKSVVDYGYEILEVTKMADFLNVLSVDLVGTWEVAAHPSPLQVVDQVTSSTAGRRSLRWTADYWLKKVPDPAVVNLGLSFHASDLLAYLP